MSFRTIAIAWSAILLASYSFAQDVPEYEWVRSLDGGANAYDSFRDVYALEQGGFVVVGYVNTRDGATRATSFIAKLSEVGQLEWTRQYTPGWFNSVVELDNHDLVAGGPGGEFNGGDYWFEARRVDSNGEPIWNHRYGHGVINVLIELKNGDLLLGGSLFDQENHSDAALVRVNGDGEVVWSHTYREEGQPTPYSGITGLRETEGGVIAGGFVNANGEEHGGFGGSFIDFLVLKVNLNGERLWSNRLHHAQDTYNYGTGLASARGGGFVMSGELNGVEHEGIGQAEMIKLNENGEQQWVNRFNRIEPGGPLEYRQEGTGILRQRNGEFVICGAQFYVRAEPRYGEAILIKTNQAGEAQWRFLSRFYLLEGFIRGTAGFNSVVQARDGGLVACGWAVRERTGQDAVIVKLGTEEPGVGLFYFIPEDTVFSVLPRDSVGFTLRARNQQGEELDRDWYFNDSLFARADTYRVVKFDNFGQETITCRFNDGDWVNQVRWHVNVTDLYIQSFTPDTLNLTVRRGASVDFAIDSVAAVGGNDNVQFLWTKSNLDNQGELERSGEDAQATIEFLQSGNYAVEGLAYREQSSDAVVWNVAVRGAIWSFAPVDITLEVLPDSLVRFEVVPSEPDSVGWSITWLVDGEVARFDETVLEWRFLGEADSCPPHLVQVIVADSVEADTVTWEVVARELGVGDEEAGRPGRPALLDVSPNPFNSMLTIKYTTGSAARPTRLAIYDVSGREVVRLVDNGSSVNPLRLTENENSSDRRGSAEETSSATWDASSVPAGVYLVRLQTWQEVSTKKVVLIR